MVLLSYEQTLAQATKRVSAKLRKYLSAPDYSFGQKMIMLHDIERNIDEAY